MSFSHYDETGFNNDGDKLPKDLTIRGSFSYLLMLSSSDSEQLDFNPSPQCIVTYGANPVITTVHGEGSFNYVSGWSPSLNATVDPNALYVDFDMCFNLYKPRNEFNTIVFFPDKK